MSRSAPNVEIIGYGCRLPGARNVQAFWELLDRGHCAVNEIPDDRWPKARYFHPRQGEPGKTYTFRAGVLDDLWDFDPAVFGISPREAEQMDPQQRLLLLSTWEALEDAGLPPASLAGEEIGVFVGASGLDYGNRRMFDPSAADSYLMTGNTLSLISNRISYIFDLHGPSFTVDTACSSSLFALNEAMHAIESGRIDTAIVGGVNVLLTPFAFGGFAAASMLSPEGLCRPFDADGMGYVRAEGAVVLVLRKCKPGDSRGAHARLIGTDANSDGKTVGVSLPSSHYQGALLKRIYQNTGVPVDDIAFVEAHGTGTRVGDPAEAGSLGRELGQHRSEPLLIGSVKSNIGHLEPASGLAGTLKAVLSLEHNRYPASLHFNTPNPDIDFEGLNIAVAGEAVALPDGKMRYAGINSFGFGGANAHAIIADPVTPPKKAQERASAITVRTGSKAPKGDVLMLSAQTHDALKDMAAAYQAELTADQAMSAEALANAVAYQRNLMPERLVVTEIAKGDAGALLGAFAEGEDTPRVVTGNAVADAGKVAFVYSGNGSQWAGMGRIAHDTNPTFRRWFAKIDKLFAKIAGWSLRTALFADDLEQQLDSTTVAQPLLFALQVGLTEALAERGLTPDAVTGHSVGEVAAAYASGAVTLEDAVRIIFTRSFHQELAKGAGKMAALMLPEDEARAAIAESGHAHIEVAASNSKRAVTISGASDEIEDFARTAGKRGWICKVLDLDYPFHSEFIAPVEKPLLESLAGLKTGGETRAFISTVTGGPLDGTELGADYWWHNVRKPVRFADGIAAASDLGCRIFVEIGPRPILGSYINDCLKEASEPSANVASFGPKDPEGVDPVAVTFARALTRGAKVDRKRAFGPEPRRRIALPGYTWQCIPFRVPNTPEALHDANYTSTDHPLLGWRYLAEDAVWHNHLDAVVVPYLADHKVDSRVVVPGAALAEMAHAAGRLWLGADHVEIRDMDIVQAMILPEDRLIDVRVEISPDASSFAIQSRARLSDDEWQVHAMGRLAEIPAEDAPDGARKPHWNGATSIPSEQLYEIAKANGLDYGPAFQRVDAVRRVDQTTIEVRLHQSDDEGDGAFAYGLHPVDFDACFHGLLPLYEDTGRGQRLSYIPIRFGALRNYSPGARVSAARIRVRRATEHSILADFELFDEHGALCATLTDARFRAAALMRRPTLDRVAYRFEHETIALPGQSAESPAPEVSDIISRASGLASLKNEADEEARLLIEAAAQRTAYDIVSELAGEDGIVNPEVLARKGELDDATRLQLSALLAVLDHCGLADTETGNWTIAGECDLPPASDILRTLVADHPAWGVECVMLNRADAVYHDRLSGKELAEGEAPITAATREHFAAGSPRVRLQIAATAAIVDAVAATWPVRKPLNILQIGISGGVLTRALAKNVSGGRGRIMVADIDKGAVDRQRLAMSERIAVDFAHMGEEADRIAEAGPYDLVVSAGGMRDLDDNQLTAIRTWLAKNGLLIATETEPDSFHDVVFGLFERWFERSIDVSFPVGALRHGDEWENALSAAGFVDVASASLPDDDSPISLLAARNDRAVVLKDAVAESHDDKAPENGDSIHAGLTSAAEAPVILLAGSGRRETSFADALEKSLTGNGRAVMRIAPNKMTPCKAAAQDAEKTAGDTAAPMLSRRWHDLTKALAHGPGNGASPVIVDLFHAFDDAKDEVRTAHARSKAFAGLMQAVGHANPQIWVVAPGGARALTGDGPARAAQTGVWAMARTASNEYPEASIRMIDFAEATSDAVRAGALADLIADPGPETEIVIGSDYGHALRVTRNLATPAPKPAAPKRTSKAARLQSGRGAALDKLSWAPAERRAPGAGEVEIEVAASGLNFRDVMWTLGMLPDEALEDGFAGATLGFECSGRIVDIGKGVEGLSIGDPVIAMAPACFATHVTVTKLAVVKAPQDIDLVAAASIPVAFLTSYYALCTLAHLEEDEWVLIHGGAGGVGLSAIQIAKWRGAKVIATAGTSEKRQFLRMLGADHVLDSRSLEFVDDVMAITGDGVDVVLNSLSGEAMERSIELVRPFGRFLELGKRDYYGNTKIGLRPFRRNVSYFGIDADQLLSKQPKLADKVFSELSDLLQDGAFTPLPYRRFESDQVVDAFRLMQQSGHIGKIVITPPDPATLPLATKQTQFRADTDGAHVIIGGLGGFGLVTARWLAEKGAGTIVLTSRRGEVDEQAGEALDQVRRRGAEVRVEKCDVTDEKALKTLLDSLRAEMPIRGVIHAAMVLDDAIIDNLDAKQIDKIMASKVEGAESLDRLTRDDKLDYFVLFSSVTTLIGNPGQAPYVSANGFLEGLARQRRENGLPALAVGWGAITDAGYLVRNEETGDTITRRAGVSEFRAEHALDLLGELIARDDRSVATAAITVAPMNWSTAVKSLGILQGPTYTLLAREGAAGSMGDDGQGIDLAAAIEGLDEEAALEVVTGLLLDEISTILRIPGDQINTHRSLIDVGMDSLMGMELRMAAQQKLGVDIPLVSISDGLTINDISTKILSRVRRDDGAEAASSGGADLVRQHVSGSTDEAVEPIAGELEQRQSQVDRLL